MTFAEAPNNRTGWQDIAGRLENAVRALQTGTIPHETNLPNL
jgi:hypothetical protein